MTTPLAVDAVLADKLRIVRLLGEGGMGSVYEVEHCRTKKRCALKLLHPHMCRSGRMLSRFWREVTIDGRIGNPHITEVHDAGVLASGEPYFVMELLSGETLAERIARTPPLGLAEICDLIGQVCEGVQAAHDAKVIHRDLKPQNLFLTTREGRLFVKVLDFGVSKLAEDGMTITSPGTALGTPAYMPPEQLSGEDAVDERSDVYSLGVVLYECATGRRPFRADRADLLAIRVREGKCAPVSASRPDLPEDFCEVVARAMAVDKADRFESARELGRALRRVLDRDDDTAAERALVDRDTSRGSAEMDLLRSTVEVEPLELPAPPRSGIPAPDHTRGNSRRVYAALSGVALLVLPCAALASLFVREEPEHSLPAPTISAALPSAKARVAELVSPPRVTATNAPKAPPRPPRKSGDKPRDDNAPPKPIPQRK